MSPGEELLLVEQHGGIQYYVRLVDIVGMVGKLDLVCLEELVARSYVV